MKYIDIHCHLNFKDFDIDRDEVIANARQEGVGMIVVGTNLETSRFAIKLAEENQDIWAIVGLHPVETPCEEFDYDTYKKLSEHPRVVGIGECGFDYFRQGYENKKKQQEVFEKQISIANEVNKPLMLHLRNGLRSEERTAYKDALDILKNHAGVKGDAHFFAGDYGEAKAFLDMDFRLSFTGVITFARDYDDVIKKVPLNMMMSETDSPYVAPASERGRRNEPAFVKEVVEKIASIKGEDVQKVSRQMLDNSKEMFGI